MGREARSGKKDRRKGKNRSTFDGVFRRESRKSNLFPGSARNAPNGKDTVLGGRGCSEVVAGKLFRGKTTTNQRRGGKIKRYRESGKTKKKKKRYSKCQGGGGFTGRGGEGNRWGLLRRLQRKKLSVVLEGGRSNRKRKSMKKKKDLRLRVTLRGGGGDLLEKENSGIETNLQNSGKRNT